MGEPPWTGKRCASRDHTRVTGGRYGGARFGSPAVLEIGCGRGASAEDPLDPDIDAGGPAARAARRVGRRGGVICSLLAPPYTFPLQPPCCTRSGKLGFVPSTPLSTP